MQAGQNMDRKGTARTLYAVARGCQLPTFLGFLFETARETFAEFRGQGRLLTFVENLIKRSPRGRQPAVVKVSTLERR